MKVPDTFEKLEHQFAIGEANEKALEKLDKTVGKESALEDEKREAANKAVAKVKAGRAGDWVLKFTKSVGFFALVGLAAWGLHCLTRNRN